MGYKGIIESSLYYECKLGHDQRTKFRVEDDEKAQLCEDCLKVRMIMADQSNDITCTHSSTRKVQRLDIIMYSILTFEINL